MDRIAILDFGSQYTQLIARRVRELGVFSEIVPFDVDLERLKGASGVILSGGPQSVYGVEALDCDHRLFDLQVPILGICYGMQLINRHFGGVVRPQSLGEYGRATLVVERTNQLFNGVGSLTVWMSHGDSVDRLPEKFEVAARTEDGLIAAIAHRDRPIFGIQFHPEVSHTVQGKEILNRFISVTRASRDWSPSHCVDRMISHVREKVGDSPVISLISGGVDSTVSSTVIARALSPDKVWFLHIDNGLMRTRESAGVVKSLKELSIGQIQHVDASEEFLSRLRGVEDPEKKRHIIGDTFVHVLEEHLEMLERNLGKPFLCQGTLYTDLIESGRGVGKSAAVIKSHHNVSSPRINAWREQGRIVEPNHEIFKDEVREVGRSLGLPEELIGRHPFPGPGLAIRILGEVTKERLNTLRHADDIYLEELHRAGLYDDIWQAFAVLLPVRSVGVMGDARTYLDVIALRAVNSLDGMTASWFPIPKEVLDRVASRIVNEVSAVGRVVLDITSKPPATIEWE